MADKGKGVVVPKPHPKYLHPKLPWFDMNMYIGGTFNLVNNKVEYVGGEIYVKLHLLREEMSVEQLRKEVQVVFGHVYNQRFEYFSMWFAEKPRMLTKGRKKIESLDNIKLMMEGIDNYNRVNMYVLIEPGPPQQPTRRFRCKNFQWPTPARLGLTPTTNMASSKPKVKTEPKQIASPTRKSPRFSDPDIILTGPNWTEKSETNKPLLSEIPTNTTHTPSVKTVKWFTSPPQSQPVPTSSTTILQQQSSTQPPSTTTVLQQTATPPPSITTVLQPTATPPPSTTTELPQTPTSPKTTHINIVPPPYSPQPSPLSPTTTRALLKVEGRPLRRVKHVTRKPKQVKSIEVEKGKLRENSKGKGKGKSKVIEALSDEEFSGDGEWSQDSDVDTDVDFVPEEEEWEDKAAKREEIRLSKGTGATTGAGPSGVGSGANEKVGGAENEVQEVYYDSDELRSLDGSDEEGDNYPTFKPEVDFRKPIALKRGLKFSDITVLRKVVQRHNIENHYVYYLLHNQRNNLTAYCRFRCGCPWDKQHSVIHKCTCKGKFKCNFRIFAQKMKGSHELQIKTCKIEHDGCQYQDVNPKVTSEYLADRYLEHWRSDPSLGLKSFAVMVQRDIGAKIGYYKAWYARARAKLLLYGDSSEEYAKVYDYGHAVLKHNPGSSVYIKTEGADSGVSVFQRMYMCLYACKMGFRAGCRPLIGVDGCHLKGAYPGMILTAISKDGSNCIYPLAWAVVEVENKETWTWFLSLLVADVEFPEGQGLTLMSDRQKGLLDAIETCLPKAEVRFCVRHIWANFKLQFDGQAFKEFFWHAARTCNKNVYDAQMEIIKRLDVDAFEYLNGIPKKHWARHKFATFSKSNMLLNNLCETFNGVLREARYKPIITCMEWIRKYVMRRNFEKLQSTDKVVGSLMPYVGSVFKWVSSEARNCFPTQCSLDEWEVAHNDDNMVVNLKERTCTCRKWVLIGIPCPHAYACIQLRREAVEGYVHEFYSKTMYLEAYKLNVRLMPGMKHWNPQPYTQPTPPAMRKLPGRPPKKNRKREAGEDGEEGRFIKRLKKQNTCSRCGVAGHNILKCKNMPLPPQPKNKGGRPFGTDQWGLDQKKKKQARTLVHQGPESDVGQASSQPVGEGAPLPSQLEPQPQPQQPQVQPPSKTTQSKGQKAKHLGESSTTTRIHKLPTKSKKKKLLSELKN